MKFKNITLLSLAAALLLSSCVTPNPSDTSLNSSSNTNENTSTGINSDTSLDSSSDTSGSTSTGINSDTTSDATGDSSSNSSSSDSTPVLESQTIDEIRLLSLACETIANEVGVGISSEYVKFTGKLLARLDSATSKSAYGKQYKLLFVDSTGYIYVSSDYADYNKFGVGIGSSYQIIGNPSYYIGAAEVVLASYTSVGAINVNLSTIAENAPSIAAVHEHASSLSLNNKGVAFSKIVTFDAIYFGKADDSVLLFVDANNAIYVHGDRYIGNQFTLGNSYRLTAAITMFKFRPGVEFLEKVAIDNMEIEIEAETLTATELYNYQYEVDKAPSYPNYSSKFTKLYTHIGYANYYYKDSDAYVVLEDAFNKNTYSTYQGARSAKALFLKNDNCIDLYFESDFNNCPFSQYKTAEPIQIMTIFMPYLWNDLDYWQGFAVAVKMVV